MGTAVFSPGTKLSGREADYSPPFIAEVKNSGAMTQLPIYLPGVLHSSVLLCRISDYHSSGIEELCLQGYNAMQSVASQPTFRINKSPPLQDGRISKARNQHEAGSKLLLCLLRGLLVAYISTLKVEAKYSSETSAEFQRTIWQYTKKITFRLLAYSLIRWHNTNYKI
jgi:hypothetical protein